MSGPFVFTPEESAAMQKLFTALETADPKLKPLIWQAFQCAQNLQFLNAVKIELEKYNVRKTEELLHLEELNKTRALKNTVARKLRNHKNKYSMEISESVPVISVITKIPCLIRSDEDTYTFKTKTTRSRDDYERFEKFDHVHSMPDWLGYYQSTDDGNYTFHFGLRLSGCNSAYHTAEHFLDKTFQLQFVAAIRESGLEFVVADPIASQKFTIKSPVEPDIKASYLAELTSLQHENTILYSRLRALGVPAYDC
jgi:hypothetical protein